MPQRGDLVVLDTQIPLSLAYEAFVYHDVIACPLWDSKLSTHDGLITLTDIIQALCRQYISSDKNILQDTIQQWRVEHQTPHPYHTRSLISCYPDQSLYEICKTLQDSEVHKVALIDPNENTVLSILTYYDILHYVYQNFKDPQMFFNTSLQVYL